MQYPQIRYVPESEDPSITLETAELTAKIIDNTGLLAPPVPPEAKAYFNSTQRFTPFTHHLGYHGIRTLYNKSERRNLVVPFVSWLNLQTARFEGLEADPIDERASYGMGRGWPLRLESIGKGAALTLDPLARLRLKYRIEFQPAEPDGIDFSVSFEFGRKPEHGPARFKASWPCYTNAYDDVRLHYPKRSGAGLEWTALGEKPDILIGEPVHYRHDQKGFYAEDPALPLGYGRIGERAVILMFSDPSVRLFVVNAGGHSFCSAIQNPAWDFEWVLEDYPLNRPVGFRGRLIYTRFEGSDRVLERYKAWAG